jgi:hypothetical protein
VSLAVRLAFLWFKGPHAFSMDLGAWLEAGWRMGEGKNPYLATRFFVWPPFWVQILYVLQRISAVTGIKHEFVIVAFLVAVECAVIVALLMLLRDAGVARRPARALALFGIALNPVCILLVCQHGNFDVLVALLVLLAVAALLRNGRSGDAVDWVCACLWLGLAIALKSAPALLLPLLLAGARRLPLRTRALGATLAVGPAAYGIGALHVLRAGDVGIILRYRSIPGWFGATGWFHRLGHDEWMLPYAWAAQLAILGAGVALGVLAWRARLDEPRGLVAGAALLLAAVPGIGPGYGPQYFYWFWPLVLVAFALGGAWMRRAVAVFGAIAAATYLFEYAVVGFLGAFLGARFPRTVDAFFGVPPAAVRVFTLVGTPLWIAYLLLIAALAREAFARPGRARPAPGAVEPRPA